MHYEINVSLHGKHFFATHARSITTRAECKKVFDAFKKAFTKEDGFDTDYWWSPINISGRKRRYNILRELIKGKWQT